MNSVFTIGSRAFNQVRRPILETSQQFRKLSHFRLPSKTALVSQVCINLDSLVKENLSDMKEIYCKAYVCLSSYRGWEVCGPQLADRRPGKDSGTVFSLSPKDSKFGVPPQRQTREKTVIFVVLNCVLFSSDL